MSDVEVILAAMELSVLLDLVSDDWLQEWKLGRDIELQLPKSLHEGRHIDF